MTGWSSCRYRSGPDRGAVRALDEDGAVFLTAPASGSTPSSSALVSACRLPYLDAMPADLYRNHLHPTTPAWR